MENELTIRDYVAIVRRRALFLILPFVLILILSTGIVLGLPPIYRSTGVILVESQQIPEDLVRSTITTYADERIEMIRQRVMTRNNLMAIAEKHQLFSEARNTLTDFDVLVLMREHIFIERVANENAPRPRRDARGTVAFELSFEDHDPELAAKVASELATLFLDENVKARTERATETTQFLVQEAQKLRTDLDAIEDRVAGYKQENGDALPEHLNLHLQMLERAESEMHVVSRDIEALEEERNTLEVEILSSAANLQIGGAQAGAVLSPAEQLVASTTQLIEKSAIYGAAHPDVRALRRQIAALEREVDVPVTGRDLIAELDGARAELLVASEGQSADHPDVRALTRKIEALEREINDTQRRGGASLPDTATADPVRALVQAKVAAADLRLSAMRVQKEKLRGKIEQLQDQIVRTPQVERGLASLNRDYENAMVKYEEVKAKQLEAQLAESLETEQKAERFVLLEPPIVPEIPIKPNKMKLLAMGAFLAVGSGAGAVLAAEALDKTVRGTAMLFAITQRHPLTVIPYIENTADRRARKRRRLLIMVTTLLIVITIILLIHFLLLPLDELFIGLVDQPGVEEVEPPLE